MVADSIDEWREEVSSSLAATMAVRCCTHQVAAQIASATGSQRPAEKPGPGSGALGFFLLGPLLIRLGFGFAPPVAGPSHEISSESL